MRAASPARGPRASGAPTPAARALPALARPLGPFLVLVAVAALSWSSAAWVAAAPTPTGADAARRVSSPTPEGPREVVAPAERTALAFAVRTLADGRATPTTGTTGAWCGLVLLLAALALSFDPRRRWRALLVGAPPVLDVHPR